MIQKYNTLKEALIAFGKDYEIEFHELESFAGTSLIYFIEGLSSFERDWRLWIHSDKDEVFHVVVDNIDSGKEVGISFPGNSFDEVYDCLKLAYSLAVASNNLKYDSERIFGKSEDLKKFASESGVAWIPRSLIKFQPGYLRVSSQKSPKDHWRIWIKNNTLFMSKNGFQGTPDKGLVANFMSFKTSPVKTDEFIKVVIFAAGIAD